MIMTIVLCKFLLMMITIPSIVSYMRYSTQTTKRFFRSSSRLQLNRILAEQRDCIVDKITGDIKLVLPVNDIRYQHISKILKLGVGDQIRCGIVDVGMKNDAKIEKNDEQNGIEIHLGHKTNLLHAERPSVDIILAVPRPERLAKLLPVISSIGVGQVALINANKVQKDYFGSHLLINQTNFRPLFMEGLSQAEVDCNIPKVHIQRKIKKWIEEDIESLFPYDIYHRFIAHPKLPPLENMEPLPSKRLFEYAKIPNKSKIVIAIGPEGGWEQEEVLQYMSKGFQVIDIGNRILRTDVAVQSLLAIAHEWMSV